MEEGSDTSTELFCRFSRSTSLRMSSMSALNFSTTEAGTIPSGTSCLRFCCRDAPRVVAGCRNAARGCDAKAP